MVAGAPSRTSATNQPTTPLTLQEPGWEAPRFQNPHALFFCRTPLQSLIAQEIIRAQKIGATVIYHPTGISGKHRYYFDKMKAATKVFVPWKPLRGSDTLTDILAWRDIPKQIRAQKFSELYISSIGSIPFSMFAARNPEADVRTFDDGTFNVNPEVFPRWISHEPTLRKLSKALLMGVDNAALMRRATRHYTIFDREHVVGIPYEIEELRLLQPLHGAQRRNYAGASTQVRVLLGTVLPPRTKRDLYEALIESPRFDLFIPHPAENRPPVCKPWLMGICRDLDFDAMIAEDVVLELSRAGLQPVIYGFNSTALLTLGSRFHSISIQIAGLQVRLPLHLLEAMGVRTLRLRNREAPDRHLPTESVPPMSCTGNENDHRGKRNQRDNANVENRE